MSERPSFVQRVVVLLAVAVACSFAYANAATPPTVEVLAAGSGGLEVVVHSSGLETGVVHTPQGEFLRVGWGSAAVAGEVGTPAIPVVRRLIVIPNGASATVSWQLDGAQLTRLGNDELPWRLLPVQPPVPKIPGAIESAAFHFDASAYTGRSCNGVHAELSEIGRFRGQRLVVLELRPLLYDATAKSLTLWSELRATVSFEGGRPAARQLSPMPGLDRVVLNPGQLSFSSQRTGDSYLILVTESLASTITSFVTAKQNQGYNVTTHSITPGTTNTAIKQIILDAWASVTPPDYVLLVGDTDTIPHWTGGGEGSPATDLPYGCMDAGDDWSPDLPVGRFPARTTAQLQAMIDKTLYVENGPLADPAYLKRAVFMASVDNSTISEGTHNWVISNYLDPLGYTSDKLYQVTYGATTQDVRDSFNDGRFYGVYSGHGGTYSWSDGPPFSQSDVNGLTNQNLYAAVWSFACITGTYTVDECFMETWVRAANKGSATAIGSSVNSYWTEDDVLEKRLFDAIFDSTDATPSEVGPVWNEARARYIAEMGGGSTTRRYFEMYNIMGDPSLRLPGACSEAGSLALDRDVYICETDIAISLNDCDLNLDDGVAEKVQVLVTSTSEPVGETVELSETNPASADFVGSIPISSTDAAGVLLVAEEDTITVTYIDADDGSGGIDVVVTDVAAVDCSAPSISNVHTTSVAQHEATVAFDVNEPASAVVRYGTSCGDLSSTATAALSATPEITLFDLDLATDYSYTVEASDAALNTTVDDNGGACYSFTTLPAPQLFSERFYDETDLAGLSLHFVPDGSSDYYSLCVGEISTLPVEAAGGTALALGDNDSAMVSVPGGGTVSFYGTAYTSVYVGSNGYLTFDAPDSDSTEQYADHFARVRLSAWFDDLNPSSGGTVSWKENGSGLVVTWQNVPEYGKTTRNTFQVELRYDGTVVVSYLELSATDGIAGLSRGAGIDPDFSQADLSEFAACSGPVALFTDGFESGDCTLWGAVVGEAN